MAPMHVIGIFDLGYFKKVAFSDIIEFTYITGNLLTIYYYSLFEIFPISTAISYTFFRL